MWVWSDELADRFPALQSQPGTGFPLVAYAVEHEADLEVFAREILGTRNGFVENPGPEADGAHIPER
jgi:hypothetical protein